MSESEEKFVNISFRSSDSCLNMAGLLLLENATDNNRIHEILRLYLLLRIRSS